MTELERARAKRMLEQNELHRSRPARSHIERGHELPPGVERIAQCCGADATLCVVLQCDVTLSMRELYRQSIESPTRLVITQRAVTCF